jgi:hypothetical protein
LQFQEARQWPRRPPEGGEPARHHRLPARPGARAPTDAAAPSRASERARARAAPAAPWSVINLSCSVWHYSCATKGNRDLMRFFVLNWQIRPQLRHPRGCHPPARIRRIYPSLRTSLVLPPRHRRRPPIFRLLRELPKVCFSSILLALYRNHI